MVYYVLMGLFDRFTAKSNQPDSQVDVAASLAPYNAQQLVGEFYLEQQLQVVNSSWQYQQEHAQEI